MVGVSFYHVVRNAFGSCRSKAISKLRDKPQTKLAFEIILILNAGQDLETRLEHCPGDGNCNPYGWQMKPLLLFGGSGPGKCNPYNWKMQPLLLFWGSGAGKCNPYCCFWALGLESATPIAVLGFWGWRMQPLLLVLKSWDWKMQPLLLFWGPGAGKSNLYCCFGVSCVSG